jgi:3-hydroxymyristoyl/3-hydroxydecanoyl-(acyl carrier protein) dehydratase
VECALTVPADLAQFEGHFPGAPVLPGVALIDWALHFARRMFGVSAPFRVLERARFQRRVAPRADLRLMLEWREHDGRLDYEYDAAGVVHASGRIHFGR